MMPHIRGAAMVVLLAIGTIAKAGAQRAPKTQTDLLTSVSVLATRLDDSALVIIHAERDTAAHVGAQIPGARFLPLRAFVMERDGLTNELPPVAQLDSVMESVGISTRSRVVIYGDPLAAARLFFTLDYLGMAGRVSLLDGGLAAWRAANLPTSNAIASVTARGDLTPRVQRRVLIDVAQLTQRLGTPRLQLFDARPTAEYSGTVAGDGIQRPGHIPGARSFFWRTALAAQEPAFLKEPSELRAMLAQAGLTHGTDVVTYCRTGVQASYLYFVFRYLGYAPRLYDGSYGEWSQGTMRPVER